MTTIRQQRYEIRRGTGWPRGWWARIKDGPFITGEVWFLSKRGAIRALEAQRRILEGREEWVQALPDSRPRSASMEPAMLPPPRPPDPETT